ncbi:MAG: hypothetical protein GAK34_02765 [Delftia tsuruhatensis]|nr:MAG: hypothetical protein GAK34_02765 [Delftia tsuruhatensis]
MAEVDLHGHAFQARLAGRGLQRGLVHGDVQRHGGVGAAFVQRVDLHHLVGQHGDLVAGHVDGGQARAAELVQRRARHDGQAGGRDVDAHGDRARAQAAHRQRVIDLGGGRVIDGKRLDIGQRQLCRRLGRLQRRKLRALGEVVEEEALPVEFVGRFNGAGPVQQIQRCQARGAAGLDHGLVFCGVLVGAEQDLVELFAYGAGAFASAQLLGPGRDLGLDLLFLLYAGQRLLQDFGRRLLEAALAGAAKVVRRLVDAKQRAGLLGQRGIVREIVACQVGEAEFFLGGEFPGQVQIDLGGHCLALGDQLGRRRLVELEQDVGGLDLDPFARVQFHLGGGVGFGEDAAGQELAGFFKQCVHSPIFSHAAAGSCRAGVCGIRPDSGTRRAGAGTPRSCSARDRRLPG